MKPTTILIMSAMATFTLGAFRSCGAAVGSDSAAGQAVGTCVVRGLTAAAPNPQAVEPPSAPPVPAARYIMPIAQGTGDGTSWQNAAAFEDIDAMVTAVGAGGTVYIRANAGDYVFGDDPARIAHGGADGNPVTIIGVDASLVPTKAVMVGSRTRWTLPADPEQVSDGSDWAVGQIILRLEEGADDLTFRFLDFQHTGHPFHLTGPTHTNITVEDCSAHNFRRFFEHQTGTSHIGTVIRRVTGIGFSKTAIRIRGDSHDVLLEDVYLNSGRQDGDNFATGVELNETAHDITMVNVTAKNCHWSAWNDPDRFWNADGFASERGNYNVTRINCTSSGNTDAGFDDKGENIRNINCIASDNNTNYKFWGSSHVNENCKALDPAFRGGTIGRQQYWLAGEGDVLCRPGHAGQLIIKGGQIKDDDPETYVLVAEGSNAQMRVIGVTIEKNAAARQEFVLGGTGSVFLYGSLADNTPPTITSASTIAALANVPQAHLLRADEPVTWSIVGGPDAAAFSLVPSHDESTLKIARFAEGSREVIVRARDAADNSTDQTITVKIDAKATVFMTDDFNRPDQNLLTDPRWRFIEGYSAPSDVRIRGGRLAIFNAEFNGILYGSPDIGCSDHYVQARVASVPSEAGGAICARAYDTWHLIGVQFSDASIQLLSRSNGDWKLLATTDSGPAVGDVLRLEVKGADATVKKNGAVILGPVATEGVGGGATRQGILSCSAAVDPWIDDYQVGTL